MQRDPSAVTAKDRQATRGRMVAQEPHARRRRGVDVLWRRWPDVGRVDLELHEQDVAPARGHVAQVEHELAVVRALSDRRRLDRVRRHPLEPALVELEPRVLQVAVRGYREPRLPEQAAAKLPRRVQLQIRVCRLRGGEVRALSKQVEEREQRHEPDEDDQRAPDPGVVPPALQVAVPLEDDAVGNRGHRGIVTRTAGIEALSGVRIASVGRADHGSGEDADPAGVADQLVVFQLRLRLVVADDPVAGLALEAGGGRVQASCPTRDCPRSCKWTGRRRRCRRPPLPRLRSRRPSPSTSRSS